MSNDPERRSNPLHPKRGWRRVATATIVLAGATACAHRPMPIDSAPRSASASDSVMRAISRASASASPAAARTVDVEAMDGAAGATRVEELLEGRLAGVRVLSVPGGVVVRIRGTSTLLGVRDPLYVIDDMPVEPGPGGMLAINPGDISTIEVLKDVASTAQYGMRGATGVIVIRTRR